MVRWLVLKRDRHLVLFFKNIVRLFCCLLISHYIDPEMEIASIVDEYSSPGLVNIIEIMVVLNAQLKSFQGFYTIELILFTID
jgi:hypothetical protein